MTVSGITPAEPEVALIVVVPDPHPEVKTPMIIRVAALDIKVALMSVLKSWRTTLRSEL